MSREQMLDLAHKTAKIVVERMESLDKENAWEGDFRQGLESALSVAPPEYGREADEVLDQCVSKILPFTMRHDHPRCFGFIPTSPTFPGVLADFMVSGYNINQWPVARAK